MATKTMLAMIAAAIAGCSAGPLAPPPDAGSIDLGEAGFYVDAGDLDVSWPTVDGGYVVSDEGAVAASRFVTKLLSVSYGPCAGFGQGSLPGVILGPPVGGGNLEGSLDVLSLGNAGAIVVSFEPNAIVDGPGPDFVVFENPFWVGGNPAHVYAEPGVVSVSDDGMSWTSFACSATNASGPPYPSCAGWTPVYSSPSSGISPFDVTNAGGNAFDLHDVGIAHARYVKIVDQGGEPCPTTGPHPITNGFDLDSIAILNAEQP